jgi:hypothetical protein
VSVVPVGTVFATAQTLAGAERQNPALTAKPCAVPVVTVTVDPATPIVETFTAAAAAACGSRNSAQANRSFFMVTYRGA